MPSRSNFDSNFVSDCFFSLLLRNCDVYFETSQLQTMHFYACIYMEIYQCTKRWRRQHELNCAHTITCTLTRSCSNSFCCRCRQWNINIYRLNEWMDELATCAMRWFFIAGIPIFNGFFESTRILSNNRPTLLSTIPPLSIRQFFFLHSTGIFGVCVILETMHLVNGITSNHSRIYECVWVCVCRQINIFLF